MVQPKPHSAKKGPSLQPASAENPIMAIASSAIVSTRRADCALVGYLVPKYWSMSAKLSFATMIDARGEDVTSSLGAFIDSNFYCGYSK
jgi:hypothetical protein